MDFSKIGLEKDLETIGAEMSVGVVDRWYKVFGADYKKATSG